MSHRTPTQVAVFYGGGPADGARRPVDDDVRIAVVVDEPAEGHGLAVPACRHRYDRQPDGRFRYVGIVEHEARLPASVDDADRGLAALRHDPGPAAWKVVLVIVGLAVVMYALGG